LIYTTILVFWLALLSLGMGLLVFGAGELIVVRPENVIIFAKDDILWRFLLSYGTAAFSMMVVASLAFLFSSLVENAIGPIVATMAVIIVFLIISNLEIGFFETIRPFLFTTYMSTWRLFFDDPIDYQQIINSLLVLCGHIIFFFAISAFIFKRKDILS